MANRTVTAEFDNPERDCDGGGKLRISEACDGARRVWSALARGGWDAGDETTVTEHADGSLLIEVEQEHAVDSYNATFTCSMMLPPPVAKVFREWIKGSAIP